MLVVLRLTDHVELQVIPIYLAASFEYCNKDAKILMLVGIAINKVALENDVCRKGGKKTRTKYENTTGLLTTQLHSFGEFLH
jgi:hypothetical protein